jgi:putative membrane protein
MLGCSRVAVAVVAASFLAGAAVAAPPTPVFLAKAGASDLYERTASQTVLASTRNPDVRRFASMMVRDHNKSTQMVKAAAMRSGLHPRPPMLEPAQRRMIADLQRARGGMRDTMYLDQQRQAHADALSLMQDYAATGSTPALRRIAGEIVPVVQHHIDMLHAMHR